MRLAERLPESVAAGCYSCEVGEDFVALFKEHEGSLQQKVSFQARKRANPLVNGSLPLVRLQSEAWERYEAMG